MNDSQQASSVPTGSAAIDDTSVPLFGREEALNMIGGDESLLNDVADLARTEIAKQMAALRNSLATGDAPSAHRQAHTLKGTVATLGAERVKDAAYVVEQAARHGDLDAARAGAAVLAPLADRLIAELGAHLRAAGFP